jgi:hypothetical protein
MRIHLIALLVAATALSGCDFFSSDDDDDTADDDVIFDDPYEENDDILSYWPFGEGEQEFLLDYGGEYGVQLDDDWYEIFVNEGEPVVTIELFRVMQSNSIDVSLYDGLGDYVTSASGPDSLRSIEYDIRDAGWEAGWFYVLVDGDDMGNPYDLWWQDMAP